MITDYSIQAVAINAIPLIFAITIHEAAHGYAARKFGDNTAYALGRVSLNPAKHIDPVGTILIPLVLILTGSPFLVGYAKPVPVNFGRLRNPRIDSIWVALAGPGSNFVQALIWLILLIVLVGLGINEKFLISIASARWRTHSCRLITCPPVHCFRQTRALGILYRAGPSLYRCYWEFVDDTFNGFL